MSICHLPYTINEGGNRNEYYENYWKRQGLALLSKHYNSKSKTLLDYGCGRGECLELARVAGFKATGTDTDPECVRLGSRFGATCILDTSDPISQFGSKSFDVVTCFHVLEHVENPKQVLTVIANIARDYVVLAVPNLRYLHRTFRRKFDISEVNEGHLQSWDHWHLLNLAERHCGLKLVEWGTDATILPFLSNWSQKILGTKATISLETGLFRNFFPFHGISVLGLFRPMVTKASE
ncbi:MAG TPA: class I SAM-dependent methyltransferase [Verrucomicrobiae bacterium]|nr:class I SAM-dependent methyltransferase [Verrucomicrobiae bacterium]